MEAAFILFTHVQHELLGLTMHAFRHHLNFQTLQGKSMCLEHLIHKLCLALTIWHMSVYDRNVYHIDSNPYIHGVSNTNPSDMMTGRATVHVAIGVYTRQSHNFPSRYPQNVQQQKLSLWSGSPLALRVPPSCQYNVCERDVISFYNP